MDKWVSTAIVESALIIGLLPLAIVGGKVLFVKDMEIIGNSIVADAKYPKLLCFKGKCYYIANKTILKDYPIICMYGTCVVFTNRTEFLIFVHKRNTTNCTLTFHFRIPIGTNITFYGLLCDNSPLNKYI